jgi:hypothetical protein
MPVLHHGVTRTVILTRKYAIKIPTLRGGMTNDFRGRLASFAAGLLANQSEYQWHNYEPWNGNVAPVLRSWLGGIIQIYPRCQPLPNEVLLVFLDPDPGDTKPDNFGLLNGRVVRVDYAMD